MDKEYFKERKFLRSVDVEKSLFEKLEEEVFYEYREDFNDKISEVFFDSFMD